MPTHRRRFGSGHPLAVSSLHVDRGSARLPILLVAIALVVAGGASSATPQEASGRARARRGRRLRDRTAGASMVAAALDELPADSIVLGSIANLTAWGEGFRATGFGKLLTDAELRERPGPRWPRRPDPRRSRISAVLATLDEIAASASALASPSRLLPLPAGGVEKTGFIVVAACDDPEKVSKWLAGKAAAAGEAAPSGTSRKDAASRGAATSATPPADATPPAGDEGTTSGVIQGIHYTCDDGVCWAVRSNTVLLARPVAALSSCSRHHRSGTLSTRPDSSRQSSRPVRHPRGASLRRPEAGGGRSPTRGQQARGREGRRRKAGAGFSSDSTGSTLSPSPSARRVAASRPCCPPFRPGKHGCGRRPPSSPSPRAT